jgi:hypothetical protein
MAQREIWFRSLFRFAPWSVIPVHWKGWAILILGPLLLILGANVPIIADYSGFLLVALPVEVIALFIVVYTHTSWDRG